MNRFLTILEVSQKQAYIFASNKLQDNVTNSAVIAWVMSPEYYEELLMEENKEHLFSTEKNVVYSGGGHIVLEFSSLDDAKEFTKIVTRRVRQDYPGIELFATTMEYVETHEDNKRLYAGDNLKLLTSKLEKKKALRRMAFHQGSFGVEKIDSNSLKPILNSDGNRDNDSISRFEKSIDAQLTPEGFEFVKKFSELGGSKGESNFVAVVHIDGNAMGKRVENLYNNNKELDWDSYKELIGEFSKAIDDDFKAAYKEMQELVAEKIKSGKLGKLKLKGKNFPVRRLITAGDDICFVTEGRIGIECAVEFIKALNNKVNQVDGDKYAACAGVAIVHQKYPFYKAYELSEMLCTNAKRFGATLSADGTGSDVSAIDWHIEFGEIKDSLEEIRQDYRTLDQKFLNLRPYIINSSEEIFKKEPTRQYSNFKYTISNILDNEEFYAKGKMKELRGVLKKGREETKYYLKFNKIESIVKDATADEGAFVVTSDGEDRSVLFDAIELVDTFIGLE